MHAATILSLLPLVIAAPSRRAQPAPLIQPRGATLIDGKYIVKLKGEAQTGSLESVMNAVKADADHVYKIGSFKGFASGLSSEELESLQNDDNVCFVYKIHMLTRLIRI